MGNYKWEIWMQWSRVPVYQKSLVTSSTLNLNEKEGEATSYEIYDSMWINQWITILRFSKTEFYENEHKSFITFLLMFDF